MKKLLLNSILLLCALIVGTNAWAATAGYTPSAALSSTTGTVTGTADETWSYSITFDNAGYYGYQASYGWQLGAGKKDGIDRGCRAFSISTSDITGTITKIEVEAGSYNGNSKINVTVGGSAFGTQNQATYSGQGTSKSTFTGSASGEIVISATDAVRAFYLKSITVTYTPSGGGGSDPSISLEQNSLNAAEEGGNGTINITYTNITNVDSEVKFYESNGTTEATYDWLTAAINTTDNTKLDYSINANTGAARTAYMKVHQKNSEVYSGLISITQAAKTVVAPTFNPEGGDYIQGTEISLTSVGNTIYYNITTNGSTPSDPTISSTQYSGPIALSSGTNKIKAIAVDTYGNVSSAVSRTYTGIAPTSLPFSWTGTSTKGKSDLQGKTGVKANLGDDYAASNAPYRLKFDGVGKYVFVYFNEKPEAVSFTAKLFNAASTGSILTVQGSADGINFTNVESFTIKGSANDTFVFTTTNAFDTNVRVIKLTMTSKDQNVGVGCINVTSNRAEPAEPVAAGETVTLTSTSNMAGWRTFAPVKANQNYTVDGTTKVYYASATADGKVTLTEIADGVPANTPVILHQTSGTTITLTETATSISAPGSNLLQVSTASQDLGTVYRLGYKSTYGVGFYTYTTNSAPAGIIYLSSVSTARDYLEFTFDDDVTSVESIMRETRTNNQYFNLAGQRVAQPTKGLYIVNGKKYVIK